MKPDNRTDRAVIRLHRGYRYTLVTIINGAKSHGEEAELWWQRETSSHEGAGPIFGAMSPPPRQRQRDG